MTIKSVSGKIIVGAIVLLLAACASAPTPEFVASGLKAEAIGPLAVLPIVDHRIDKSKELKLEKNFQKLIKKRVKKAHYEYTMETDPAYIAAVTRDGLEDLDSEMISKLGPADSRWILLLVLNDADSKLTFGSTGSAEVTGYLFDKQAGEVLWRNKELGEAAQGGLLGMTMKGAMQQQAAIFAIQAVLKGLPEREKH